MNQFVNYEEFAERHNAAFAAFKTMYSAKTPPPVLATLSRDYVSTIIILALTVVMVASVIVSSSRTITEFGGDFVGVSAFVMLEGGLVAYAFFRARRNAGAGNVRLEHSRRWAALGLGLAFVSAIGANINNVLLTHGIYIPQGVNTFINLLVAVSAPTMAFISSDVLALELMSGDSRRRQAQVTYDEELRVWNEGLNNSWNSQKSRWGVEIRVSSPTLSSMSNGQSNGQNEALSLPSESTLGHKKQPDASSIVQAYLEQNPDAINIPVRELATQLGVGKSTVANVIKNHRQGGNES